VAYLVSWLVRLGTLKGSWDFLKLQFEEKITINEREIVGFQGASSGQDRLPDSG